MALVVGVSACAKDAPVLPSTPSTLTTTQRLQSDLAALLDQPGLRRTTWGVAVESLSSGDRLFERNPGTQLIPGSTMKLVTAAATAAAAGWDYTFETTVAITGPVEEGVLRGDLVIVGTGDPSLEGRAGTSLIAPLLAALREQGIRRIDGRIIGDDNLVEEPRPGLAWSWDDLGVTTGAVAGALNIGENTTRVSVASPREIGAQAMLLLPPDSRDLPLINRTTTGPRGASGVWAEQRPGEHGVTIAGTIAIDQETTTLTVAVGNPTLWAATLVRARLLMSGVEVTGAAVDIDDLQTPLAPVTVILRQRSRPLREIAVPMLKNSINMYADAVLRLATGPGGARTIADGASAAKRQLREWGIPDGAVQPVDGSGLSRFNLATAEALVAVLKQMRDVPAFADALAVAGVDGTLENRMKDTPAAGKVRAKTGSMTNVRSLAGYVTTRDGESLAFAITANNFESGASPVIAAMDQIAVKLAAFSRR